LNFSIIIPTFRRVESLTNCLRAIELQKPAGDFEVLVVNDGGGSLGSTMEPFLRSLPLQVLCQANGGPASARNRGAIAAAGEHLIFLDDDCQPHSDWLASVRSVTEQNPTAMIGGRTVNLLSKNDFAATSQLLIDFLYQLQNKSDAKTPYFFTSNNLSVPKKRFLELGGFDQGFRHAAGEDREFCLRWQRMGWPFHYDPNIVVGHLHRMKLGGFLEQHFRYGEAASRYWGNWSNGQETRSIRAVLRLQAQLIAFVLHRSQVSPRGLFRVILAVVSQASTVLGYCHGSLANSGAESVPDYLGRDSTNDGTGNHIFGDNRISPNNGSITDGNSLQDHGPPTDPNIGPDPDGL
jgi:GT2 family glycosyltransferase